MGSVTSNWDKMFRARAGSSRSPTSRCNSKSPCLPFLVGERFGGWYRRARCCRSAPASGLKKLCWGQKANYYPLMSSASRILNKTATEFFEVLPTQDSKQLPDWLKLKCVSVLAIGVVMKEYPLPLSTCSFTRTRHLPLRRANRPAGIHDIPAADPQHSYGLSQERRSNPHRRIRISP